jgi:DNA primase
VARAERAEIDVDGRTVSISSPGKVLFPERGETKLDLVRYYQAVTQPLLAAMGGRPVLMERYPEGAAGKSFFQKRVPDTAPDWLTTTVVSTPNGTTSRALVVTDLAHVLWAVNLGCLGCRPRARRRAAPRPRSHARHPLRRGPRDRGGG